LVNPEVNIDRYRGSISPNKRIYDASSAAGATQETPNVGYGRYGAQDAFEDNYRALAPKAAMDLMRANTQSQNEYYNKAADIQNRGALTGLGLLGQQRANAYQRQDAERGMQYKWMNDIMSGVLGGLL